MNSMYIFFMACVFYIPVLGISYGIVKIAQVVNNRYGSEVGLLVTWANIMLSGLVLFVIICLVVGVIHQA